MNLASYLKENGCDAELGRILGEVIPKSIVRISSALRSGNVGLAGTTNATGDSQLALDVQSNDIVMEECRTSGLVSHAASEELEDIVEITAEGKFALAFDPLDGSSLVDVNLAVGSIFGVYPPGSPIDRCGDDQLAACFAVYGPRTTLVITWRKGVHEFRLQDDGLFYLHKENIGIDLHTKYFAPGNLRAAAERADYLELTTHFIQAAHTLRYSGGMVPDVNHIFLKGSGIFTYPGYSKAPDGKLRLLFECNPMALLAEQAGGAASDGTRRILEKQIREPHQRTPLFLGSKNAVEEACRSLSGGM